jgi:hypothetical protein
MLAMQNALIGDQVVLINYVMTTLPKGYVKQFDLIDLDFSIKVMSIHTNIG